MQSLYLATAIGLLVVNLSATRSAAQTLIDLTHSFNADTIYWPTEPGFELDRGDAGVTERGYFYAANRFSAPEHGGTHIDAPYHFAAQGRTVDKLALDKLVGSGVCVDVSAACAVDRDYLISIDDLKRWEAEHDDTLAEKIILLRTGHARHWPDREKYLGTTAVGRAAVEDLHFPGLDPAAASWLSTARRIRAVGIDTPSIDNGPSRQFQTHVNLFQHNIPALENVADMQQLPATGFEVMALPMKIEGGTGGPCRVVVRLSE